MRDRYFRRFTNFSKQIFADTCSHGPVGRLVTLFKSKRGKADGPQGRGDKNAACTRCWRTLNCSMFGVTTSDDYQPVTWVGRHPVHVPLLLVAVHVFLMVVACVLSAFGAAGVLGLFIFDSAQVLGLGRVWQIVTYAFVHLPYSGMALLWFAVEMYM